MVSLRLIQLLKNLDKFCLKKSPLNVSRVNRLVLGLKQFSQPMYFMTNFVLTETSTLGELNLCFTKKTIKLGIFFLMKCRFAT